MRLAPASRLRVPLPSGVRVRSNPKLGEARFLRLAIRKQNGGRVAVDLEDAQAHEPLARYDLGQGSASFGAATRIWEDGLPENTIVVTRDLFADFGNIDLVAVTLHCVDGGEVHFEQVELGTARTDFDEPISRKSPSAR